jgi:hypothetical protein
MVWRNEASDVQGVEVSSDPGASAPIEITCRDQIARLTPGETVRLVNSIPQYALRHLYGRCVCSGSLEVGSVWADSCCGSSPTIELATVVPVGV